MSEGLSQLTFGRLAKRLGTSDRIVVYYFPTKNDLITEVLVAIGLRLQHELEEAFGQQASDHVELAVSAWPVLARQDLDPIFALYFEAIGLAAAGREPYRALVTQLMRGWIEWLAESLEGTAEHRRSEAEAAIALIDGLLLMRAMAGPEAADRAASRLNVLSN